MNETGKLSSAVPRAGTTAPETGETIDLANIARSLLRRKWFIFRWIVLAVAIAAVYVLYVAVPKYTAFSSIVMVDSEQNISGLDSVISQFGGDDTEILTEREILQSRRLFGRVVDKLELTSDPEFNPSLRPDSMLSLGSIKAMLMGRPDLSDSAVRSIVIDHLVEAVVVRNVSGTFVFEIIVTTEDPAKSTLIANTMADLYISRQVEGKLATTELATEWLTGRASALRVQLEAAENRLTSFSSSTELVSPEDLELRNVQLKDFRSRLEELHGEERRLAETSMRYQQAASEDDLAAIAAIVDDAALNRILDRSGEDETAARAAVESRIADLRRQVEGDLTRVRLQIDGISRSITDLEEQVAILSNDLLTLQQLQREAEAARLIYEHFLVRLQETAVQEGLQQPDSEVLSYAETPLEPSAPRKTLIAAAALLLGLFISSSIVILRESQNRGLRTATDAEDVTGINVLGQLPRAPVNRRGALMKYVIGNPTSGLIESVRNLRTSIQLSFLDRPPQVLMMTSSLPNEGKSSSTMMLAHAFAQSGQRILVMECDVRRRALREFYSRRERNSGVGLFAVSAGELPLEEAVVSNPEFGFDTLLCEQVTVSASEYFLSRSFANTIAMARQRYDMVLLDAPPVLAVTDARIIGKHCDSILFAVQWDSTHRDAVVSGVDLLQRFNLNITGLVMTQIDTKKQRAYGASAGYGSYYTSTERYYGG